jgi:hypothetical protein
MLGVHGTGLMAVVQPEQPGQRVFPPRCSQCEGKGKCRSSKGAELSGWLTDVRRRAEGAPTLLNLH